MTKQRHDRRDNNNRPLTATEILNCDNIPASEAVPADVEKALATTRIVLRSDDAKFDPRSSFKKVEGVKGVWELCTTLAVTGGPLVQRAERVEPGSLKPSGHGAPVAKAFRPLWQPYVYHPKSAPPRRRPPMLTRKSGAKVRPHIVYNHDDREAFVPLGYPWHCVGRLFVTPSPSGAPLDTGTGVLVGSRTVLTSAHMIPWGRPNITIRFVAGYIGGESMAGPGGQSWATDVSGYNAPKRQGFDLAVIRLAEPLGDWLGTFGTRTYDDDWEDDPRWTLVGYPGEIHVAVESFFPPVITSTKAEGEVPTRQFGISVEDDDSDGDALEIEHHGDSTDGNSGGPLFGHWPNGPYAIGIESGGQTRTALGITIEENNVAAGGNAMVNLVRWARETWV